MKYIDSDGVEHEIVQHRLTRNHTLKAIKVTGNYLVRQKSGMLRWVQPNDDYKIRQKTGDRNGSSNLEVIANIRLDNTPHSPDLFVYTTVKKGENGDDIAEENRVCLKRSRKWYVRQFESIDRVGLQRFGRMPLKEFLTIWRKPMDPMQIYLRGCVTRGSSQLKFASKPSTNPKFDQAYPLAVVWKELIKDSGLRISEESNLVLPWLAKNCRGRIYPFSDYTRMFELHQDEFCYITDLVCRSFDRK